MGRNDIEIDWIDLVLDERERERERERGIKVIERREKRREIFSRVIPISLPLLSTNQ